MEEAAGAIKIKIRLIRKTAEKTHEKTSDEKTPKSQSIGSKPFKWREHY